MRSVAWDSWAFLEVAFDGPRRAAVERLLREVDYVFTVREVVAECFNFLVRRTRRTEEGWLWWTRLLASGVRVFEPPLNEVREFVGRSPRGGSLSFTDYVLAFAAMREGAKEVATGDHGFERLGLTPLFARRPR